MHGAMIYFIFFLSGIAGLIYQVFWLRQFGQIFGNTIYSASIVTGVFVCGLGIGSYVAGRLGDSWHLKDNLSGLRYYVIAEFIIDGFILPYSPSVR